MKKEEVLQYSPLVWAYMGDAVYEMYIREYVISQGLCKNGLLHRKSIKFVSAKAQCAILKELEEKLTEEELDIVRRGRNANPHSTAKNADIVEYKYATGFEALIGFLHLTEQKERLDEILKMCVEFVNISKSK
ncbi:MAG: Mini-ribonuclease 3 [Clostridia bacterium]|nr:Mini-ribonuclease 3 [Clostridia bacterium]